jgi:hypothetical protein
MTHTTKNQNFISDEILREVAKELQPHFEFNLTSRSPLPEIAESARDLFADRNLQPRWSALVLTAKIAKAMWMGTLDHTKQQIN